MECKAGQSTEPIETESFTEKWIEGRESISVILPRSTCEFSATQTKDINSSATTSNSTMRKIDTSFCNPHNNDEEQHTEKIETDEEKNFTSTHLTIPAFCPLCCNYEIVDPLLLHECDGAQEMSKRKWCVACQECVLHWQTVQKANCMFGFTETNGNDNNQIYYNNNSICDTSSTMLTNSICCPLCNLSIPFLQIKDQGDDVKSENEVVNNNNSNSNLINTSNNANYEHCNKSLISLSTVCPEVTMEWMKNKNNVHTLLSKLFNVSTYVLERERENDVSSCPTYDTTLNANNCNENIVNANLNGAIEICNVKPEYVYEESCTCGVCETNTGTWHCRQCGFALCKECCERTHNKGRFKEHVLININEYNSYNDNNNISNNSNNHHSKACSTTMKKADNVQGKRYCVIHTDQTLELYCKTCELPTCVHCCFSGPHRAHNVVPISEMSHHADCTLTELTHNLTQLSESAERSIEISNNSITPAYDRVIQEMENNIVKTFHTMYAILKKRENALCYKLHTNSNHVKQEIGENVAGLNALLTTLRSVIANIEHIRSIADVVSLIQSTTVIKQNCEHLTNLGSNVLKKVNEIENALLNELVPSAELGNTDLSLLNIDNVMQTNMITEKMKHNTTVNSSSLVDANNTSNALVSFELSTANASISLHECVEFLASLGNLHTASTLQDVLYSRNCELYTKSNELQPFQERLSNEEALQSREQEVCECTTNYFISNNDNDINNNSINKQFKMSKSQIQKQMEYQRWQSMPGDENQGEEREHIKSKMVNSANQSIQHSKSESEESYDKMNTMRPLQSSTTVSSSLLPQHVNQLHEKRDMFNIVDANLSTISFAKTNEKSMLFSDMKRKHASSLSKISSTSKWLNHGSISDTMSKLEQNAEQRVESQTSSWNVFNNQNVKRQRVEDIYLSNDKENQNVTQFVASSAYKNKLVLDL